jgi:putative ABC transport system permease protein
MIIRANIKEALKSLQSAKQRTLLALIGIVIGIASVIAMVSIGTIVKAEVLKQFKDLGMDIISIQKMRNDAKETRDIPLADIMAIPSRIGSIKNVAPYCFGGIVFSRSGKTSNMTMLGVTESFFKINHLKVKKGRSISDLDENTFFCVLGEGAEGELRALGYNEFIGKKFKFGDSIYTVIGILDKAQSGSGISPPVNESVITHISTGLRTFGNRNIEAIMARTDGATGQEEIRSSIQNYFDSKIKGTSINIRTAEELIAQMEKQMRLFTLLLGAIGSIALIVGGVGVMNVMLVSVSERKKEIGIRRAIGAQREDIQSQFIIESIILCMMGGIIGIALGVGISYIVAHFSKWEFMVSVPAVLLGVGVSTLVGVFFGFYPSRQAAKLDPITALRM